MATLIPASAKSSGQSKRASGQMLHCVDCPSVRSRIRTVASQNRNVLVPRANLFYSVKCTTVVIEHDLCMRRFVQHHVPVLVKEHHGAFARVESRVLFVALKVGAK